MLQHQVYVITGFADGFDSSCIFAMVQRFYDKKVIKSAQNKSKVW